jgi:hypothetical protein
MDAKKIIAKEIEALPDLSLNQVIDFFRFFKNEKES